MYSEDSLVFDAVESWRQEDDGGRLDRPKETKEAVVLDEIHYFGCLQLTGSEMKALFMLTHHDASTEDMDATVSSFCD